MKPDDIANEGKKKLLYTYWHELPFQKMVDTVKYFQLEQSDVKHFIIKYIRDGIEDEFGRAHGLRRRHAFTAKELKDAYEMELTSQKYSISNFHFHINSLVEEGYIQEITKILEGRHYVSYYGRTAISFDPRLDEYMSKFMDQNIFDPLKLIIKKTNPKITLKKIDKVVEENKKLVEEFYSGVNTWTQEMYSHIYNSKLDLFAFERYISHYAAINKVLSRNLETIADLIGLSQYIEANSTVRNRRNKNE